MAKTKITVNGTDLRPGDVILHPAPDDKLRSVYKVVAKPRPSPGAWCLRCKVKEVASGAALEIAVGPTVSFMVERKEKV